MWRRICRLSFRRLLLVLVTCMLIADTPAIMFTQNAAEHVML